MLETFRSPQFGPVFRENFVLSSFHKKNACDISVKEIGFAEPSFHLLNYTLKKCPLSEQFEYYMMNHTPLGSGVGA